jgi:UDP-N-acetylglucosamine pyrophosphorylase
MDMVAATSRIEEKMRSAGIARPAITSFLEAARKAMAGDRGWLPEETLEPVESLPELADLRADHRPDVSLLSRLVVVKLNGGLGTGMGLDRTKSLIRVRDGDTFLDFVARQVLCLREWTGGTGPGFCLMNSFVTREETLAHLEKYPELEAGGSLDFLQSRVPKLDATTLDPVTWAAEPELEWCPPGHGDFYPSLLGSGLLDRWLAAGQRYLFVSNSDNLGATVDLTLLDWFAGSEISFLMEVAARTASDRKGGHLARRRGDGRLVLRESAQCPKADEGRFQDIDRHRYFNTNNLWIRLDHLKVELDRHGGTLPLPLITNTKTVDPRDPNSPVVLQLESAMGAAIERFDRAGAILVPRSRFSPVKTTSDLLALRSDAYAVTGDHRLILAESRGGRPPAVDLDPAYFRVLAGFEERFRGGPPSLIGCESLAVRGDMEFEPGVICRGRVTIGNSGPGRRTIAAGVYENITLSL